MNPEIPRVGPAFPDFANAPFKNAVVQIGCGKFVAGWMECLPETTIYAIGHGRHPLAYFVELLKRYHIALVCDVQSVASSRWPQFNATELANALRGRGTGYALLPECGGNAPAPPPELARGLDRIVELAAEGPMVLMCSESQPLTKHARQKRANCHRVGMLATPLRARGARIIHILPDGTSIEFDESAVPSIW